MPNYLNSPFVLPCLSPGGVNHLATWDFGFGGVIPYNVRYGNYNCEEDVEYWFKHETQQDLSYTTVRGVAIRYVNLGQVTVTVTVVGMYSTRTVTLILGQVDPSGTGNAVENEQYYGAPPPLAANDYQSYTAFFYFQPFTDEDFQVKIFRSANSGNLVIEQVAVIGDGQEYSR